MFTVFVGLVCLITGVIFHAGLTKWLERKKGQAKDLLNKTADKL